MVEARRGEEQEHKPFWQLEIMEISTMETETWKPIEGYEGLYEVSNLGRVRGIDRMARASRCANALRSCKGKLIAPSLQQNGYYLIGLSKDGKSRSFLLHRLVAQAFVPGRTEEKNYINHKDRNRANNIASNLEWCSCAYNVTYEGAKQRAWATRIANSGRDSIIPPKAVEAWKDGNLIKRYPSAKEAALDVGKPRQNIYLCCNNKTRTCAGYQWRYVTDAKDVHGN